MKGTKMKRQTRREFLKTLGFMAGSASAISILPSCNRIGQITGTRRKRPNIIFIMTDDHASHALSCYGSKINQTPNLDRIAAEGMLFSNSFCTNSICAPCRAVILTGKYSHIDLPQTAARSRLRNSYDWQVAPQDRPDRL